MRLLERLADAKDKSIIDVAGSRHIMVKQSDLDDAMEVIGQMEDLILSVLALKQSTNPKVYSRHLSEVADTIELASTIFRGGKPVEDMTAEMVSEYVIEQEKLGKNFDAMIVAMKIPGETDEAGEAAPADEGATPPSTTVTTSITWIEGEWAPTAVEAALVEVPTDPEF